MNNNLIAGKTKEEWMELYPIMTRIISTKEVFWKSNSYLPFEKAMKEITLKEEDVREAEERLKRFAPYIAKVFPETKELDGIIESPLIRINNMQASLGKIFNQSIDGDLLLKCDNMLPVSGSIKARGGIYEVLKYAEDLLIENNMLSLEDDYSKIESQAFKDFFSTYTVIVGSTGNLGLSIGIISAKLGFNVTVHMSSEAKTWKKKMLQDIGVTVVEHEADYGKAVESGREQEKLDEKSYFVDDENSIDLFLGYAVAAYRMKKQLEELSIVIDEDNPLFVYLPCGVGGGPGGVAFGLKLIFKDHVHCFFAEPTHSPCMLIGLLTGEHDNISVQDFGIDNITIADGLAVGRPSGFVGKILNNLISGCYTVSDNHLYSLLSVIKDSEGISLEPSASAGIYGPGLLMQAENGRKYLEKQGLVNKMNNAIHVAWATGGSMVPKEIMDEDYKNGKKLIKD